MQQTQCYHTRFLRDVLRAPPRAVVLSPFATAALAFYISHTIQADLLKIVSSQGRFYLDIAFEDEKGSSK